MISKVKQWIKAAKLKYALRCISGNGLSVVRIVERAGTKYIIAQNGAFYKIGKRNA